MGWVMGFICPHHHHRRRRATSSLLSFFRVVSPPPSPRERPLVPRGEVGGSEKEATPHENEGDRILIEVSFGILINIITGLFRVACRSVENPLPTYFLLLPCPPSLSLRQNYPRIVPFGCRMELDFLFFSFFFCFLFQQRRIINRPRRIDYTMLKFVGARRKAE